MTPLRLDVHPDTFAICRMPPDAAVPGWATAAVPWSITRTESELSIVCPASAVPPDLPCEDAWRCLTVRGLLDFALVGVLAALAAPLARAGVSIFALSSYDTDRLFVRAHQLGQAVAALREAGHHVSPGRRPGRAG
jgi:hypothetical protein